MEMNPVKELRDVKQIASTCFAVRLIEEDESGLQWYSPRGNFSTFDEANVRYKELTDKGMQGIHIIAISERATPIK